MRENFSTYQYKNCNEGPTLLAARLTLETGISFSAELTNTSFMVKAAKNRNRTAQTSFELSTIVRVLRKS